MCQLSLMKSKVTLFQYQILMMLSQIYINNINPNIIVLKNELGEMRKRSRTCVIRFHNVSKLKSPEEHYLRLYSYICPREMRMN